MEAGRTAGVSAPLATHRGHGWAHTGHTRGTRATPQGAHTAITHSLQTPNTGACTAAHVAGVLCITCNVRRQVSTTGWQPPLEVQSIYFFRYSLWVTLLSWGWGTKDGPL